MKRILAFVFASMACFACQKELDFQKPEPQPNISITPVTQAQQGLLKCAALELPNKRSLRNDPAFFKFNLKRMKVIFLDFDGFVLHNTWWNYSGKDITCKASKFTPEQQEQIHDIVAEDWAPWNVKISTDEKDYDNAPVDGRMRVIICDDSWQWYGRFGGVSYVNSMFWGDNTPCFVFADLLGNNVKYVAEAATHEAGHTVGLNHYADWLQNCIAQSVYWPGVGTGNTSYANIMGVGYYRNVVAFQSDARSEWNCDGYVDQIDVITQALGRRIDLISDDIQHAFPIAVPMEMNSVLENSEDVDMYEIVGDWVNGISLESGGNTDLKIEVYVDNKLRDVYQDKGSLNVAKRTLPDPNLMWKMFGNNRKKHRIYVAVRRSDDETGSFIPTTSSTGGYKLHFYR